MDEKSLADEARKLEATGEHATAEMLWRSLVERTPDHAEAARSIASSLARNGHYGNSLVYLTRAVGAGDHGAAAVRIARDCLAGLAGDTSVRSSDDSSAEEDADLLADLIRDASEDDVWPTARQALVTLALSVGIDEERLRKTDRVDQRDELSNLDSPEDLLARFRADRGENETAPDQIRRMKERLEDNPEDAEAWYALARDCLAREKHVLAEDLFRRAAFLQPTSIKFRIALTRTLALNGHYVAAYRAYQAISALPAAAPTDAYHLEEVAANQRSLLSRLILLTRQAVAEGDVERAWSTFLLIREEDDLNDADGIRAAILRLSIERVMKAHKNEAPETISLARDHLRRDPESVYVRQVLGQALMTANRYREASEVWGSLTVSLPDNARMQLQYAKCLERTGAGEAALEAANRALELDETLESARIISNRQAE